MNDAQDAHKGRSTADSQKLIEEAISAQIDVKKAEGMVHLPVTERHLQKRTI